MIPIHTLTEEQQLELFLPIIEQAYEDTTQKQKREMHHWRCQTLDPLTQDELLICAEENLRIGEDDLAKRAEVSLYLSHAVNFFNSCINPSVAHWGVKFHFPEGAPHSPQTTLLYTPGACVSILRMVGVMFESAQELSAIEDAKREGKPTPED